MLLLQALIKTNPPKKREETRETSQEEGELQELKKARQRQNENFEIYQAFALAKRINMNGPNRLIFAQNLSSFVLQNCLIEIEWLYIKLQVKRIIQRKVN